MQTSGLTGSSDIAISRKYGSTHPRHHESKDRQAMLTCFRWVSHHLLQANCAGVKYLYETPLFSGLLDSVTSGQPGTGSPILCQGSKVTLAQRRPRAKTRLRRAGWPAWKHLLVSLPGCCSSCPWPGSGSSARQCHVPQRCHLCFGAGCSGEHPDATLCQCLLRSICRFVVTAEQTLFSQQPHCLTLPNGQVSPLSPEMP